MEIEISDELATPGCPQCAIKHLSTALAITLNKDKMSTFRLIDPNTSFALVDHAGVVTARALINLTEALHGYKSHRWYAIGLLAHAEELYDTGKFASDLPDNFSDRVRDVRLRLMYQADQDVICVGKLYDLLTDRYLVVGHILEAARELPVYHDTIISCLLQGYTRELVEDLVDMITSIEEEFVGNDSKPTEQ